MRRFLRATTAGIAAAALLGVSTPPASAGDGGVFLMQGIANITGGVGYPILTGIPGIDTNLACEPLTSKCGNLYITGGNQRTYAFGSSFVCIGAEFDAGLKGKGGTKGLTSAGLCNMNAAGTLWGFCGFSHAMGGGLLTINGNTYLFDYLANEVNTKMVLFFQWWKGSWTKPPRPNRGFGLYSATPDAVGTTGQSCTNKTQQDYLLMGPFYLSPTKGI